MPDLRIIRKRIPTISDVFNLILSGDWHIGQEATNEDNIQESMKWLKTKDPRTHRLLLTGDLIENVHPTSKGSLYEMAHSRPEDQMDIVVELLTPVREYILAMCDGNHEYRTMKAAGVNLTKSMARRLKVDSYDYRAFLELTLGKGSKNQKYNIFVQHGAGGIGKTVSSRYSKLERSTRNVDADIFVQGHIHHKLTFSKRVSSNINGEMSERKVVMASNGSYLRDPEYAVRSGFEPTEKGDTKIELGTKRYDIHCRI